MRVFEIKKERKKEIVSRFPVQTLLSLSLSLLDAAISVRPSVRPSVYPSVCIQFATSTQQPRLMVVCPTLFLRDALSLPGERVFRLIIDFTIKNGLKLSIVFES